MRSTASCSFSGFVRLTTFRRQRIHGTSFLGIFLRGPTTTGINLPLNFFPPSAYSISLRTESDWNALGVIKTTIASACSNASDNFCAQLSPGKMSRSSQTSRPLLRSPSATLLARTSSWQEWLIKTFTICSPHAEHPLLSALWRLRCNGKMTWGRRSPEDPETARISKSRRLVGSKGIGQDSRHVVGHFEKAADNLIFTTFVGLADG